LAAESGLNGGSSERGLPERDRLQGRAESQAVQVLPERDPNALPEDPAEVSGRGPGFLGDLPEVEGSRVVRVQELAGRLDDALMLPVRGRSTAANGSRDGIAGDRLEQLERQLFELQGADGAAGALACGGNELAHPEVHGSRRHGQRRSYPEPT